MGNAGAVVESLGEAPERGPGRPVLLGPEHLADEVHLTSRDQRVVDPGNDLPHQLAPVLRQVAGHDRDVGTLRQGVGREVPAHGSNAIGETVLGDKLLCHHGDGRQIEYDRANRSPISHCLRQVPHSASQL